MGKLSRDAPPAFFIFLGGEGGVRFVFGKVWPIWVFGRFGQALGSLVPWSSGPVVLCLSGPLAFRSFGPLVLVFFTRLFAGSPVR